jgi:hypothetical protein
LTPEDVLLEAMTAAARYGDSQDLRVLMCAKMVKVMRRYYEAVPYESNQLKVRPE